jgi:hypothetical protein
MGLPLGAALCVLWSAPQAAARAPHPNPTELVNRAVALVVTCAYDVQARQERTGSSGLRPSVSASEHAIQTVDDHALPRGPVCVHRIWASASAAWTWTVTFAPAPSVSPARTGEDVRLNQAMNNMTGFVQIDRTTGGVVHLREWLQEKCSLRTSSRDSAYRRP